MTFRIRYRPFGQHVQCFLFAAQAPDRTYALCGSFRVRLEEMADLQTAMQGVSFVQDGVPSPPPPGIEYRSEEEKPDPSFWRRKEPTEEEKAEWPF